METLRQIAAASGGLVTTKIALANGVKSQRLTDLTRRGLIARVAHGVYAVGNVIAARHDPASITRSWRVVLSYQSAAAWWGIELPKPVDRLHVTAPRSRGRWRDAVSGVRLHRATLRAGEVMAVRGVRVTSPLRTVLDIARRESLDHAVAIADSFMRARAFNHDELLAAAGAAAGPGRLRVQLVASLADQNSGSILESLARVLLWRNNLAPTDSQLPMRLIERASNGRVDFAWKDAKLVLECDGYEFHAGKAAFRTDRRRWNTIERAGWRLAIVTWWDVTDDPAYVVALVRDLLTGFLNTNGACVTQGVA